MLFVAVVLSATTIVSCGSEEKKQEAPAEVATEHYQCPMKCTEEILDKPSVISRIANLFTRSEEVDEFDVDDDVEKWKDNVVKQNDNDHSERKKSQWILGRLRRGAMNC